MKHLTLAVEAEEAASASLIPWVELIEQVGLSPRIEVTSIYPGRRQPADLRPRTTEASVKIELMTLGLVGLAA